ADTLSEAARKAVEACNAAKAGGDHGNP
ncbi:hypothetical protein, partial [Methylobacterium sp. CG09_land_8_20_14_0_10_71_15]